MKKLFVLLLIIVSLNVKAQYIYATSDTSFTTTDQRIGTLTTAEGVKYPLYLSMRGKIYYWKISAAGHKYKVYTKHPYYRTSTNIKDIANNPWGY